MVHKNKLIEFRSYKHHILLGAGHCLLFALAMLLQGYGKDALVFARVWKVGLLGADHTRCRLYILKADDCSLAAKWGVTSVRCIVLDKDSIQSPRDARAWCIGLRSKPTCRALAT
jgi:hypothetical protein